MQTAPPLLMTKLHPPPAREQMVPRARLVERLEAAPGIKLTIVAAPAGCGKTTLLGTWRESQAPARPVGWLTLDEGDNDPVVLWSYVLAALRGVCPSLEVPASPELVGATRLLDRFLPALVNGLAELGEAALVLDDFHRLSSGPARDSVGWFIDNAPSTFQLVVATRSEPALPLPALRAHGELVELRAEDLAFTRAEADALLNDRLELELDPGSVDGLIERTEGWAAGLYLAGLSLRPVEDRESFVSRFGGRNRHVVDFLVDEVLEAHDPATQTLMLRASILDRLTGPLCDAVLEREGSGRLLEALSRANLFLLPLDDRGEWYRFHHLFAQLLRVELEHRDPGLASTLHRRAFAWHRDHGSVEAAIEHALEAAAFAEAGDVIAAAWTRYVHAGRYATVLAWLERFPREVLRENQQLRLVEAWVLAICGRRQGAVEAMAAVEELGPLDAGPLPDGFSSVEASLATLRGAISWGDIGGGLEHARRAAELEGGDSEWRPVVCWALGESLYYDAELDEADVWLSEAAELGLARQQSIVALNALSTRSLIAGDQGRVDLQTLLVEQAMELAEEAGLAEGEALVALAASLQARGRLDAALSAFERGTTALRLAGHPRPLANGLIRHAELLASLGRRDDATAVAAEARTVVDACPDPRMLAVRLAALERPPQARRRPRKAVLSERELAILRMLKGTLSERDIGRELYLSHNTIHSHTRSIYRKLEVSSRSEAVEHGRELGLI